MRIYLDTSVYNRPFDDQSQPRIWLETMAFVLILQMVETGEAELARSSVVDYENSLNRFAARRRWVQQCLELAHVYAEADSATRNRARQLEAGGIKAVDALHLACAEAAACDCFVTCDDLVVRRYVGPIKVLDPAGFVLLMTGD